MTQTWTVTITCDELVHLLTRALMARGYSVHRSFDLGSARDSLRNPHNCLCPHHGTFQCACQYIVLLIRIDQELPFSIVAHGHNDGTILSVEQSLTTDTSALLGDILREVDPRFLLLKFEE